jgi:prepilin-type N-terminal cleavage/methylation domain-containing protein
MKYKGFTLIEVLIVMGILVILMAIGIVVGRYAIERANRIEHQDVAEKLFSSLVEYKMDNKQYPKLGTCSSCIDEQFFAEALGYKGTNFLLKGYYEELFEGGNDATYYYYVEPYNAQFVIVCVSLGGIDDEFNKGHFCTGDGIGILPEGDTLDTKNIGSEASGDVYNVNIIRGFDASDWYKDGGFASQ